MSPTPISDGSLSVSGSFYHQTLFWQALMLAVALTAVFYVTAPKESWSSDPLANMLTAWSVAGYGTFVLEDHRQLVEPEAFLQVTWIMRGPRGPVSMFPPGTGLLAAPLYLVGEPALADATTTTRAGVPIAYGVPPIRPAVLLAATSTSLAVTLLFLTLTKVGANMQALAASLLFAFGTGSWSVASQALWQHGPAMMWLAVALWTGSASLGQLAWVPAILTRPLTAAMAGVSALYNAIKLRRWRTLLAPGLLAAAGAGAFLAHNRYYLGSWSPIVAYEQLPTLTLLDPDVGAWVVNIAGALADPRRGLLVISPFLIILLPGLNAAWRQAPLWVRSAALGGVAYLLLTYKAHHFAGGDLFFGYRYPLEALLVLSPLLLLSYQVWVAGHRVRVALFMVGAAVAIGLQAVGVLRPYSYW